MKFSEINLLPQIQQAIKQEGYEQPTPIQEQAIPPVLEGKDVMGIAQTGTGKTAAFTLPLLQRLHQSEHGTRANKPRALILTPTRELAAQIGESIKNYGKQLPLKHVVIFGGVGQNPQVQALNKSADIVVATPGRLLDLMNQGHVQMTSLEVLVLDEADRMLDMGFVDDVEKITKNVPKNRQTLFFSATMSKNIDKLAREMLRDPIKIEIAPQATTADRVEQKILYVEKKEKDTLLLHLLNKENLEKVLIFTRTKHKANKLTTYLSKNGIRAEAIHGNKSQTARTKALAGFHNGRVRALVATDIAARGIDVDDISHVIQYDLPDDTENYVHRIGRTARAGAKGVAYALVAAEDKHLLKDVEKLIEQKIPHREHEYHSARAKQAPPVKQKKGRNRGKKHRGKKRGKAPWHNKKRRKN